MISEIVLVISFSYSGTAVIPMKDMEVCLKAAYTAQTRGTSAGCINTNTGEARSPEEKK